ncbi:hypothetical protein, partial [Nonomuraea wenchangensis]
AVQRDTAAWPGATSGPAAVPARIGYEELGPWRDAFRSPAPAQGAAEPSEDAELTRLRAEIAELRAENGELRRELDVLMRGVSAWVQNLAGRTS